MKKTGALIILMLFFCSFALAQPELPDAGVDVGGEDVEKIQEAIEGIPLDPETGGLDEEKITGYKSKAEQRIDAINLWLDENVWWLKWIFGMKPEVSWLFAINFLLILTFLNGLVLNGENVFIFASKGVARLIGLALFLFLLLSKFILNVMAVPATTLITTWWGQLIIILALIIVNPLMIFYFKYVKGKREETEEEMHRQKLKAGAKIAEAELKAVS